MPTSRTTQTWRISAAMLLIAAMVFAVYLDAPLALAVPLLGIIASGFLRRPLPVTSRTVVYSLIAAAVLMIMGDQVLPITEDRFSLINGKQLGPLLLYIATALLFLEPAQRVLSARLAIVLVIMAVCTGYNPNAAKPEYMGWVTGLLPDAPKTIMAAAILELLLTLLLVRRIERRRMTPGSAGTFSWRRWFFPVAALATAIAFTLVMYSTIPLYERFVGPVFDRVVIRYLMRYNQNVNFTDLCDLWRNRRFRQENAREPIVRVQSLQAPGYLRGRAYLSYTRGTWCASLAVQPLEGVPLPVSRLSTLRFKRLVTDSPLSETSSKTPITICRVFPTSHLKGTVLPVTAGAATFDIMARGLLQDNHGTLFADDWTDRSVYTFETPEMQEAYPLPNRPPPTTPEYLQLPKDVAAELKPVLSELTAGLPPQASDARRVSQVCQFLGDHCTYALNVDRAKKPDPVLQFLLIQKRGHCELFATAAVMLLRMQGIPARYVTGVVCEEKAPAGYWIARLKDAHAWAEAWLRDEQRWVQVEATPAGGIPRADATESGLAAWIDRMQFLTQRFMTWLREGHLAEAIWAGFGHAWDGILWLVAAPWRALVALLLLSLLGELFRRWWRKRKKTRREPTDPARKRLEHEWHRHVRRLHRHVPPPADSATPREWAVAAASRLSPESAVRLRELLEEYESLRYSPEPPTPEAVTKFAKKLRMLTGK